MRAVPDPTEENVQEVLLALKENIDLIMSRSTAQDSGRVMEIIAAFQRNLVATFRRLTLDRLVMKPQQLSDTPTGQSLPGEVINMLAGSLFLGRGETNWGQIFDNGATLRGGTWSFTSGSNQVIPKGHFIATPVSGSVRLDIYDSSWQTANRNWTGGFLPSDGVSVRLFENASSTANVDYLQWGP